LAYASWSVVFGEQPSAAKWNILGTNDASFNDGTGIANNAIVAGHIATGSILLGYGITTTSQGSIVGTETDLTSMTATVTVPTGGRDIMLQFMNGNGNATGGSADQFRFYFKEGATYLNAQTFAPANAFGQAQNYFALLENVSAGSHTYKLAAKRTNGSGTYATNATPTSPETSSAVFLVWGL
jgi:hypothetical protein